LLSRKMSAVVLAGGDSTRMGENKMLMPMKGKPLISHVVDTLTALFDETVVVAARPEDFQWLPVRVVGDMIVGLRKNSLAGIHAGLSHAHNPDALVVGGDMPFLRPQLLTRLCEEAAGFDVAIPREGPHLQPLCAVYHKNCLPHIENLLRRQDYKITGFFPKVQVRYVDAGLLRAYDPGLLSFYNINTPAEYRRALRLLKQEELE
jgi:molybdenum cofactor guanylyltransferase